MIYPIVLYGNSVLRERAVEIAKGEVVMVGEKFGIRFTEVADPEEMVQNL